LPGYNTIYQSFGKRALDVLLAMAVLPVIVLLVIIILIAYVLTGNSQPIFKHDRIGMDGKVFTLFKFRTLTSNTDRELIHRQFRLGRILRLTSLDELPQFFNVIMGQMSIVGPRPLPVDYGPLFTPLQNRRHQVRPGITGWAQVNGRTNLPWQQKFDLDLFYIENVSLWLDLKIMVMTAVLLLSFRTDNSLTESKFERTND
jgi:lipopolysaccharide/colanic/teichoic acid biosynthesis glycosyltransferase